MSERFYIIQFVNTDIKVEALSYLDTTNKFDNVEQAVFIGESIAELIKQCKVHTVEAITESIMITLNLSYFTYYETVRIRKLVSDVVNDYLK